MVERKRCATSRTDDPYADLTASIQVLAESGNASAARVAEALAIWLNGSSEPLEAALGVAPGYRMTRRLRRRDDALRRLARRFAGVSKREAATQAHKVVARYRNSAAWPRDRAVMHRPDGDRGLAFDVLMNGALPCVGHVRAILALAGNSNGDLPPRPSPSEI
jgi:hypothetical protein